MSTYYLTGFIINNSNYLKEISFIEQFKVQRLHYMLYQQFTRVGEREADQKAGRSNIDIFVENNFICLIQIGIFL